MKPQPEVTHTPTPWGYVYDGSSEWSIGPAEDPQSNPVMNIWSKDDGKAQANAAFICRAVNSHEYLLQSAKLSMELFNELRRTMDEGHWFADDLKKIGESLSQAIAKAEGNI